MLYQLFRLLNTPFNANLFYGCVILALLNGLRQVFGNINMKYFWQYIELVLARDWFDAWNDWHVDTCFSALVDKIKVLLVVEKHLSNDVLSAEINL